MCKINKKQKATKETFVVHPFEPVFGQNSEILILGSFPSVKSRMNLFYYGHPQNRFWKVIASLMDCVTVPETTEDKKKIILKNKLALWDVVKSCEITGSSDSSIKNVVANDLKYIISASKIKKLYANGSLAYSLYMKHCFEKIGIDIVKLPSTSPANAKYSLDMLIYLWRNAICGTSAK